MQRHPEFVAEREEGREEGREQGHAEARMGASRTLLAVLASRGLTPTGAERRQIDEASELDRLHRWLAAAATSDSVVDLLRH